MTAAESIHRIQGLNNRRAVPAGIGSRSLSRPLGIDALTPVHPPLCQRTNGTCPEAGGRAKTERRNVVVQEALAAYNEYDQMEVLVLR